MKSLSLALVMLFLSIPAQSATVAIIDSGTDMLHLDIAPKAWINPVEIPNNDRDEDRNGYQDDVHGWNFAEGNNKVIDYKYLGSLTPDIRKFFEVQEKAIRGTASEAEITWMRTRVQDQEFIKSLSTYANFMHGTHVSGIAAGGSDDTKIMAVKLIPTEVGLPGQEEIDDSAGDQIKKMLLKAALNQLAKQQMKLLVEIADYVNNHKVDVANGSFGTGYAQARMIVDMLFQAIFKREPTEVEGHEIALTFINTLISEGAKMMLTAPDTLFVFAAGNDGTNNDKYPTSPTNIKAPNVISVAATLDNMSLAVFSNFGVKMVDVAAPGVGIRSSAPGNQYLNVSGTSQAAPYVAGVAAQVKDQNKALSPRQIKDIIMNTVDGRDYLKGKVKAAGIVNTMRAIRAGELSLRLPVSQAVAQAKIDIADQGTMELPVLEGSAEFVMPLPSLFKL